MHRRVPFAVMSSNVVMMSGFLPICETLVLGLRSMTCGHVAYLDAIVNSESI